METFAMDRNLYEVNDVSWNNDDFDSISMKDSFTSNDPDWTVLLDNPPAVILNDRMITDALHSPRITSSCDHSYSLVANGSEIDPDSPLGGPREIDDDLELECFPTIPLSTATTSSASDVYIKQEPLSAPSSPEMANCSIPKTHQSLLKQPTIILATRPQRNCSVLYPKINIKVSSPGSNFSLPPTPPSSTSSDSDGSLSPEHHHHHQPCSPPAALSTTVRQRQHSTACNNRLSSPSPLISCQPKGATGMLQLTEEEKRTLVAEGYPIPSRLPLSKAEEKSLKKIRRKIKNKISAQESRRKKKEYMDALEKKVEILTTENTDYKKRLDSLENNNMSLLSQLQKLQAMIGGVSGRVSRSVSTQTVSSLLMVVFCFTMCMGSWGIFHLASLSSTQQLTLARAADFQAPGRCISPVKQLYDPYATPAKQSRLLLAFLEELDAGNIHHSDQSSSPSSSPGIVSVLPSHILSEHFESPAQVHDTGTTTANLSAEVVKTSVNPLNISA